MSQALCYYLPSMQPVLSVVEASHTSGAELYSVYCGDNKWYRFIPPSTGFWGKGFCLARLEPSNLLFRYMISCLVPGTPFFTPGCLLEFTW